MMFVLSFVYQELENFRIFHFGSSFEFLGIGDENRTIFCSQIQRTAGVALLYQWIIHFSLILKFLINNYFLLIFSDIDSG